MTMYNSTIEEAREVVAAGVLPRTANEADAKRYVHECKRHGVDPLSGLLVPIPMGGKLMFHAGIDLCRSRAALTGEYAGSDTPVFDEDGNCVVTVYRMVQGVRCPFGASAAMGEYNTGRNLWKSKPRIMLSKVCEMLALRKAFPENLAGLYESSELQDEAE